MLSLVSEYVKHLGLKVYPVKVIKNKGQSEKLQKFVYSYQELWAPAEN